MNDEFLLLEDLTIPVNTFAEYKNLDESYHNFLPSDVEKKRAHAHEVFSMLTKAYESQGGIKGSGFKSPEDMQNIPMWKLSKKNGKVTAAALYKDQQGRKRVATCSDGSDDGRKAVADIVSSDLKRGRAHMEISGKSLSFIKKHADIKPHLHTYDSAAKFHASRGDIVSRPAEDDPELIRHPELKDHFFVREIGGEAHTKVMMGKMGKPITEAFAMPVSAGKARTKEEERAHGADSALRQGIHKLDNNWAFDTGLHGPAQAKDRQPNWKPEHWHDLLNRGHAAITDPTKRVIEKGVTPVKIKHLDDVMVYSKKHQQGFCVRVVAKNENNLKEGGTTRLETVLPHKKSFARPSDKRIVIESASGKQYIDGENLFFIE